MKSTLEINRIGPSRWKSFFSYLGWLIGFVGTCTTIYLGFIQKKEPKLEYDILTTTNFINKDETAVKLKIFVDSLDIQQNRLNISAYTIKVQNKGTDHISQYSYDKGSFGLKIRRGELLEQPTLLESSTKHISDVFPKVDSLFDKRFVIIPNLSLDVDDYYILRIVLLHSVDSIPSFEPEGKIVGQRSIIVNKVETPSPNFWNVTLGGNWQVQIVRYLFYIISIPLVVVLIILPFGFITDRVNRSRRKRIVKELEKESKILQFVKKEYIEEGELAIENLYDIYKRGESDVTAYYNKSKRYLSNIQNHTRKNREAFYLHIRKVKRIEEMLDKGYLQKNNDSISFTPAAQKSVEVIYTYLKENGLIHSEHHYDEDRDIVRYHLEREKFGE